VNAARHPEPNLPRARGPLSELVLDLLRADPRNGGGTAIDPLVRGCADALADVSDPLGDDDLQLALYLLYGLHYRSFHGVDPRWEWHPATLAVLAALEEPFERALRDTVTAPVTGPGTVGSRLFELEAADDGPPLSRYLERESTLGQFEEFVIHRSAYQLKEADPHSWAIPRLTGPPKAALVEVQFDEYGSGRPERMHSRLFATTMRTLGLDDGEDAYLDRLPGTTLATVNLMSHFGLHRRNLGALVGHLAMFEMTSSRPNRGYANGLRRLGFGPDATDFYDEHVEADAVHENIAAYDMAGGLAAAEPGLAPDILFGAAALLELEQVFAARLLDRWGRDESSLMAEKVTA
jgi:hypothetical protein